MEIIYLKKKKKKNEALSTTKAEYSSLIECTKRAIYYMDKKINKWNVQQDYLELI